MKHIAIIPARSGSKGLKDKNIKELCGKPLLAYSVDAAKESGLFDCIHVSTDSEQYAEIAKKYGADVPFLRSLEQSSDSAGSWGVVKEVLRKYHEFGQNFDMITLLQPTSPLRTAADLKSAFSLYEAKNAEAVVAVCEIEHSPLWSNTLNESLSMDGFLSEINSEQRQNLKTYYRINGAIYMVSKKFLDEDEFLYRDGCYAYVMAQDRSIDIDHQLDFDIAELIIKREPK